MTSPGNEAPIERGAEIKRLFAERRNRRLVVPGIMVIGWLGLILWSKYQPMLWTRSGLFIIAFSVFAVGMFGFQFWNWRCPACNRYLGRTVRNPAFCPNCGVPLV